MSKSKYFIVILLVFSLNQFIYSMEQDSIDIFSSYLNEALTDEELRQLVKKAPWRILGINNTNIFDFSRSDIEQLARPLLFKYHSDRNKDKSESERDKINELYKHINNAKDALIEYLESSKWYALYIVRMNFLWDILNSIKEINKIRVLGSADSEAIYKAAKIDCLIHTYSPIFSIVKFHNIVFHEEIFPAQSNIIKFVRGLSLLPNLVSFKFLNKDFEIIRNSHWIAKNNKYLKKDFKKERFTQYVWLAINKLFPYASLIASRMINENVTLLGSVRNYEKLKEKSFNVFEISKAISHISELLRKKCRYEIELGNYKSYKANKDMKKMFQDLNKI